MSRSTHRRAVFGAALVVVLTGLMAPTAGAAVTPEVKVLQRQVKTLKAQVASLRSELNALKATVGNVAAKADAANTAATAAGENATAAVTKTNCLVNGTGFVVWNNFVYFDGDFFTGTGMDIARSADKTTGYLAGVNPSCIGGVLPRFPATVAGNVQAGATFNALERHPH